MTRIWISAGVVCIFLVLSSLAWAQPKLPFGPTDRERLMLPEECRGDAAKMKYYEQQLPGLVGLNHYCYGMNFLNRARLSTDKTEKRFNLESAIGEFGYVFKHSAPNAQGLQQVQTQRDLAAAMLKAL